MNCLCLCSFPFPQNWHTSYILNTPASVESVLHSLHILILGLLCSFPDNAKQHRGWSLTSCPVFLGSCGCSSACLISSPPFKGNVQSLTRYVLQWQGTCPTVLVSPIINVFFWILCKLHCWHTDFPITLQLQHKSCRECGHCPILGLDLLKYEWA